MRVPVPAAARRPARAANLRATVWRWHFYAGLLSIPVIVVLCLSGIVYLFKPQVDAAVYGSMRSVEPQAERTTYASQAGAALAAVPGGTVVGLAPPPDDGRASEFDVLTADGGTRRVHVDPYTGEVTGVRDPSRSLSAIALDLHGTLLTSRFLGPDGVVGDRIIELTACWAVVLVISGLYLWWPRGRTGVRRALVPRLRASSVRMRWRDVHAVTGVLFGFTTLFLLLTGLAWSGVWGDLFQRSATATGTSYPSGLFAGAQSRTVADVVPAGGKPAWAAAQLPLRPSEAPGDGASSAPMPHAASSGGAGSAAADAVRAGSTDAAPQAEDAEADVGAAAGAPGSIPEQGGRPGHAGHAGHAAPGGAAASSQPLPSTSSGTGGFAGRDDIEVRGGDDGHTGHVHAQTLVWDPREGAPLDAIVGQAQAIGYPPGFTVAFPADAAGSYTVSRFPDADVAPNVTAGQERLTYLDQYTALPMHDYRYGEFGAIAKAMDVGIAVHEGRQWGLPNQLLVLIATLALLLSCATAVVMWRRRRPRGLGSPRRQPNRRLGAGVVVITLALGALFPLLGLSILALLAFDVLIVRRMPPLARWLGAA